MKNLVLVTIIVCIFCSESNFDKLLSENIPNLEKYRHYFDEKGVVYKILGRDCDLKDCCDTLEYYWQPYERGTMYIIEEYDPIKYIRRFREEEEEEHEIREWPSYYKN